METPQGKLTLKRAGALTEHTYTFAPPAVIGRFDASVGPVDVDLGNVEEGSYVSRKHARISFGDEGWTIEDLASSNGTFLLSKEAGDFVRVETAELQDGTEIAFGNARFWFEVVGEVEAEMTDDEPEAEPATEEN